MSKCMISFSARQAVTILFLSYCRFCAAFLYFLLQDGSNIFNQPKSAILGTCKVGLILYEKQSFTATRAVGQRCIV